MNTEQDKRKKHPKKPYQPVHYQLIPKTKVFSDIKTIQTLLKRVGFYKGEINGQSGPETLQAVKELQKSKSRRRTQTKTLKKRG